MSLSRRQFLVGGASLSAVALTGCGSTRSPVASSSDAVTRREPARDARADVTARYLAQPSDLDLAGTIAKTWSYDGQIPGKLLRAKVGDLVEVTVDNALAEPTSIHWHGVAIVNSMDGVPGLTQPDTAANSYLTYRFTVPDSGTFWFHPHHGLQLDRGLYAPFIIDDPDEQVDADVEYVLMLDDWLDGLPGTPEGELARIRKMGASMTGSTAMDGMAMGGTSTATSPLLGGDAGDAVYPFHLINGRPLADPLTLDPAPKPGDRVRLRIINAGGDTAYRLAVGGHRLTVTHTDGFPVRPVEVDAFVIGMGERYDVTFTVASGAWPIIALAEGKNMRAAAILRTSDTTVSGAPNLDADIAELDGKWLRYSDLHAADRVALTVPAKVRTIPIELTGGMMRSDWGFNNKPYATHQPIDVEQGEWVTLEVKNATTMWHPVHVHGHTPQLTALSGGVRKDTVNVLPGQTTQLTFQANNPGQWMLHCHNAYHLEAGMATVLSYVA